MGTRGPKGRNGDVRTERDGELLRRFVAVRDQAAFRELVRRHGPLVMGVCGRVLANPHDREDAFQATFLTLASRAGKIRKRTSLASWLHGVAMRIARNLQREDVAWRKSVESGERAFAERAAATGRDHDLRLVLDDELDHLPAKYKDAILLCDYYGHSHKEAADALEIPLGTLATHLRRGRELLRKRLLRCGVTVSTGGLATSIAAAAQAVTPISAELIGNTTRTSMIFLASQAAGQAVQVAKGAELACAAVREMMLKKGLAAAALCVIFLAGALGISAVGGRSFEQPMDNSKAIRLAGAVNGSRWNSSPSISSDGLELYFHSDREYEPWGTWMARRNTLSDDFGLPERVADGGMPDISYDGLSLYVNTGWAHANGDIFVLQRPSRGAPWGPSVKLGPNVNTPAFERWPTISADNLELYFTRSAGHRGPDFDIWVARRERPSDAFGRTVRLPETINADDAGSPCLSTDGLKLFFASNRPGGVGGFDIWVATRASRAATWGEPLNLGTAVNTPHDEWQPDISADGEILYFSRSSGFRGVPSELFQVEMRHVSVDFDHHNCPYILHRK